MRKEGINMKLLVGIALAMVLAVACGGDDDEDEAAAAPTTAPAPAVAAQAPTVVAVAPAPRAAQATPTTPKAAAQATAVAVPPPPVAQINKGGTLNWSSFDFPGTLDPVSNTQLAGHQVNRMYLDFLFGWDSNFDVQPQMIGEWSVSGDAKEFSLVLRDGLSFHDGTPVTVDDVLASMERWHTGQLGQMNTVWNLSDPTVEKVDSKTFKLNMGNPFGEFAWYTAFFPIYVWPEQIASKFEGNDTLTEYVGSGPFKLTEWRPGDRVLLDRFAAYNPRSEPKSGLTGSRIAYLDNIVMLRIPDATIRAAALQVGQVDIADQIPADHLETLKADPNVEIAIVGPFNQEAMQFNKTQTPFTNSKARHALQLALDYEEVMVNYGPREMWTVCHGSFTCTLKWASDVGIAENFPSPPDLDTARRLWKEAMEETGYTGQIMLLNGVDRAPRYGAGLVVKAALEAIGADVAMPSMDFSTVIQRKIRGCDKPPFDGGWHIYMTAWFPVDPILKAGFSTSWSCGWPNEDIQRLIGEFAAAPTLEDRRDLVDQMQLITVTETPFIQFGEVHSLNGFRTYLKGYEPFWHFSVDGVWLDK